MSGLTHPASWWTANNPILELGQIGQEDDTGSIKAGDGVTSWNNLTYQEQREQYTTASGTNTYIADLILPSILGYGLGMKFRVKFTNANTGASTININSFGAISLKKNGSNALQNLDIIAGGIYEIEYDGTNFQIVINTAL